MGKLLDSCEDGTNHHLHQQYTRDHISAVADMTHLCMPISEPITPCHIKTQTGVNVNEI